MLKLGIIGADSFIAGKFINSIHEKKKIKLFSRYSSNKPNEIIKEDLRQIMSNDFKSLDVILNFAAIVHQPNIKNEILYKKINTELPIHLACEAKKAGVRHFIQMSTLSVYGNVNNINVNTLEHPVSIYGKTKLAADKVLLELQKENFCISIIRPPLVYGGGNAPGNMMNLIKFAQKGIPLPFKRVKNSLYFIHVENLVQALNLVIDNKITGVVITTDNKTVSIEEIIDLIKKNSSKPVRQFRIPKFAHLLCKKIIPSIYKKVFGNLVVECNLPENLYQPKYGIEVGIKEMISFIEKK